MNIVLGILTAAELLTAGGADTPGVLIDGSDGAALYSLTTGKKFDDVSLLADDLARKKVRAAVISSWMKGTDVLSVLDAFRAAKIKVAAFYVIGPDGDALRRINLVADVFAPSPVPPEAKVGKVEAVFRNLTIRDLEIPLLHPKDRAKSPYPMQAKYLTIHNTAEPFSARQERDRVAFRRDTATSFHYAVDEREAVRLLPLEGNGFHAGDGTSGPGNRESIGIEICRSVCRDQSDALYRVAEENAAKLCAYLLKKLNLPLESVRYHHDWSGKFCPHRILEEKREEAFRARILFYFSCSDSK